jgi:hypothetical protein
MSKVCISCGMPMEKPGHFPLDDERKDFCLHCSREDGTMKSYHEALAGMSDFIVRTQGQDAATALEMARSHMAKMPAWKEQS